MIPFFLFLTDFLLFAFFKQWIIQSLLVYFVLMHCTMKAPDLSNVSFYVSLFLLLLQDFFLYDRFGLGLILLAPLIFFAYKFQRLLMRPTFFFPLFLIIILFVDNFILRNIVFSKNITFFMTIEKIFINISIGYVILLGLRSNRSFLFFTKRGGKSGLQAGKVPHKID